MRLLEYISHKESVGINLGFIQPGGQASGSECDGRVFNRKIHNAFKINKIGDASK
jgi:hypothetical protein